MAVQTDPIEGAAAARQMNIDRLALWLIVFLGALLRLVTLGHQSLWLDESISFWTANRSYADLILRAGSSFRPFYHFVLQPFVQLGHEEWILRLPSALVGIASIFIMYLIAKELFDQRTGLLAALLLAISPIHIWYSQEARMYALVTFFVMLAALFAVRALRRNAWLDWILLGVFEGLALWTEVAAIWFVLAINLAALFMVVGLYRQGRLWAYGISQTIALLIYLPAISNLFGVVEGPHTRWIPPATLITLFRTVAELLGGFMRTGVEGVGLLLLVAAIMVIGASGLLHDLTARRGTYLFLGIWSIAPVAISFLVSQTYFRPPFLSALMEGRQSIFLTRNLITVVVPTLLLLARSLILSPYRRLSLGVLVALVLLNLTGYLGNTLPPRKEDYRQAARIVEQGALTGDLVLTSPGYIEQPFAYYYRDPAPPGLLLESLRDGIVNETSGWQVSAGVEDEGFIVSPVITGSTRPRLWMVTSTNAFHEADNEVLEYLEQHARLVESWQVTGVVVQLYDFYPVSGDLD